MKLYVRAFMRWVRSLSKYRRQRDALRQSLLVERLKVKNLQDQIKVERTVNEQDRGMRILKNPEAA